MEIEDGTFSGGTFIGTGSLGMLQAFSVDSSLPVIVVYYEKSQSAGTAVTVLEGSQKKIASVSPAKAFTALIFGSPELKDVEPEGRKAEMSGLKKLRSLPDCQKLKITPAIACQVIFPELSGGTSA